MRRAQRLQWTLAQLLLVVTVAAVLMAYVRVILRQPGGLEALWMLLGVTLVVLLCSLPMWISWLAECLASSPRQAVWIADSCLLLVLGTVFGLPAMFGELGAGLGLVCMIVVVWVLPAWYYSVWRDDTLSKQLAAVRRLKSPQPMMAIWSATADDAMAHQIAARYRQEGYVVFLVHPLAAESAARNTFSTLREIPYPLERICLCLPPLSALEALDEVAAKGCRKLLLPTETATKEVVARAVELELYNVIIEAA